MKFIIVDDSEYKVNAMKDSIKELFVNAEVISFNYGNAALKYLIKEETFEDSIYLILDMNFPSMSDSHIKADNGLIFMHKLSRKGIDKKIQTIIFSSDKVDLERFTEFDNVIGSIRHSSSVSINYDLIYIVGKYGKSLNPEDLTEYGCNMFFDTVINTIGEHFCGLGRTSVLRGSIIGTVFYNGVIQGLYRTSNILYETSEDRNRLKCQLCPIESEEDTKHIEEVSKRVKNSPEKAIKLIASKKSSGRYERNSKKNNMNKPMWR